jgi:hypothetical protein
MCPNPDVVLGLEESLQAVASTSAAQAAAETQVLKLMEKSFTMEVAQDSLVFAYGDWFQEHEVMFRIL